MLPFCVSVLSLDLSFIIQDLKKKREGEGKGKKGEKSGPLSALCFVACLCPLARTV